MGAACKTGRLWAALTACLAVLVVADWREPTPGQAAALQAAENAYYGATPTPASAAGFDNPTCDARAANPAAGPVALVPPDPSLCATACPSPAPGENPSRLHFPVA